MGWQGSGERIGTQRIGDLFMSLLAWLMSAGPWLIAASLACGLAWSIAKTEGQIIEIEPIGSKKYQLTVEIEGGAREMICDAFHCRFLKEGDCVVVERIWDTVRGKCH